MTHSAEAMHRMGYHPVTGVAQQRVYEENRAAFMEMFDYIETIGQPSRERSLALTELQNALMWLNAHVACNGVQADA